jgi:TonB-dependent receptor
MRKNTSIIIIVLVGIILNVAFLNGIAQGQSPKRVDKENNRGIRSVNPHLTTLNKFDMIISIDFEDADLEYSLRTIAEKGGILLSYSPDVLPANKLVTLQKEFITVAEAFNELLAEYNVGLLIQPPNRAVLTSEKNIVQQTGEISGTITDKSTGEVLVGANVVLQGTTIGSATNNQGVYSIRRIPAGRYILVASYIGYLNINDIEVTVTGGEVLNIDFQLEWIGLMLDEVAITAQAEGQMKAINQQLSASSIVSVVSSARIQELPDANAAESIGRLPGVYITRVGGEGTQVVVRGLAPKYNVITIDGMRMASSNPGDRSADLSMISSDMLEGIEVYKTVTADQDADVLGGTVNFRLREANGGQEKFRINLLAQGGYTGLSNAYNKYNNYKIVPGVETRLFDRRLGVLIQANFERRNLASNEFGANYRNKGADYSDYLTQTVNLHNVYRDRQRINGALLIDYRLPKGKISLTNFSSSGITEIIDRNQNLIIYAGPGARNQHIYSLAYSKNELNMMSNTLNIERQLSLFHADLKLSHAYSETKNPDDWAVTFYQSPAGINQFENVENLDPKTVVEAVFTDPARTRLNTITTTNSRTKERTLTASLDMDMPMNLSETITSIIKFGGQYRTKNRSYSAEVYGTNATFISPSARGASQLIVEQFGIQTNDPLSIPLTFFLDDDFNYGKFLDGDYEMHNPMHFGLVKSLVRFAQDNVQAFASAGSAEAFARNNYLSNTNNYSGREILAASYVMATVNLSRKLTIIPGIRYQNLKTSYSGVRGQQSPLSYLNYDHSDTTITVNHPYWLPNVNIRYKPFSWFDIRLAYSNTISYPDFNAIIPRIDVTTGAALAWNNYNLKPSQSKNYDLYLTFFENRIGLFTVGGFLKQIENLIYPWIFNKAGLEAIPYYLTDRNPAAHLTYNISTFVNSPYVINNYGLEFDWQTHFWYLPNPLKGLIFNVNYTRGFSKAEYPYVYAGATSATDIDTSFSDRLLFQPNHIVNLSIGYDYKSFSVRVSMIYHDDVFVGVSQWPQLRAVTAQYRRWDVSFRQRLPWFGLQMYGDINNLNGERDYNVLQMYSHIPRSAETYGLTANIGLRWQF